MLTGRARKTSVFIVMDVWRMEFVKVYHMSTMVLRRWVLSLKETDLLIVLGEGSVS